MVVTYFHTIVRLKFKLSKLPPEKASKEVQIIVPMHPHMKLSKQRTYLAVDMHQRREVIHISRLYFMQKERVSLLLDL